MGKRELVLISVFVLLGIGVYHVTAPPPVPGSEGISVSSIFRNMKREIHGSRESATADSLQTVACDATVRELRVNIPRTSDLTVTGEDRDDVSVEFHATARGFDQAEAKAAAKAPVLRAERVGDAIVVLLDGSAAHALPRNGGMVQMTIVLRVPRRLTLRIEPHTGPLTASNLAAADIMGSRGETRIRQFAGRVALTHSGGELEIDHVAALKLSARNSRGSVKQVAGPMAVDANGGNLTITDIVGPLEIESRNADLKLDGLKALKVPLRINSNGGELRIVGLRSEARIDGRNATIEVVMAAPAPVTIYNVGALRVTPPPGGYTLDASASEARITIEDGDIKPSEGPDARAAGAVRGGGPTITLRSTRGIITIGKPLK